MRIPSDSKWIGWAHHGETGIWFVGWSYGDRMPERKLQFTWETQNNPHLLDEAELVEIGQGL